ncbi:histidine kinase [Rhodocaloribacter litoris]|uniref:ATP-binding protein n=1 Tax=Rhodocaloribacter litoris TaxID=2558931 RepID=UPI00142392EE|nr:ATP-binding protein [Rhodocaloribacter litoris]QXD15865.1 histidine kinase [Rhodocaloribacter litoris]
MHHRMRIHRSHLGWLLFVLCLPFPGRAQHPAAFHEGGLPLPHYTVHFSPDEYGAYHQNWAVVQDGRGIVYVGNNDGVLEYDGVRWRLIRTGSVVRSLAVGVDGRIYAGLKGDFGYLAPDSLGVPGFVSLLPEVDPAARDFKDVWGTHATPDGIYFQTNAYLFRWDGVQLRRWSTSTSFHTSFSVRGRLFVREAGVGLEEVAGDALRPVPDGERFKEVRVYAMLPYEADRILVATREAGLFLYDGQAFRPFATEADPFLEKYSVYHGAALPGGRFALATLGGGVLVIDRGGRLVSVLAPPHELPDNVVNFVYADAEGGLWAALNNSGIARVAYAGIVTQYDRRLGLAGAVYDVRRHQGRLYVATGGMPGVYALESRPLGRRLEGERSAFVPVENVPRAWSLLSLDSTLFVGSGEGIYQLRNGEGVLFSDRSPANVIVTSRLHDGVIYVGRRDRLDLLRHTDAGWVLTPVPGVTDEVRQIVEEADGTLWIGTRSRGVLRLRFTQGLGAPPVQEKFGVEGGLVEQNLRVAEVGGRALFFSDKSRGVYRFGTTSPATAGATPHRGFYPDPILSPLVEAAGDTLKAVAEDADGNVWLAYTSRMDVARPAEGGQYRVESIPALHFPKGDVEVIYTEPGVLWLGSGEILYRYLLLPEDAGSEPFKVLVRRVSVSDTEELLYAGAWGPGDAATSSALHLAFEDNDLAFEVAAPVFTRSEEIVYRYRLEGYDTGWSAWTPEARRTYRNLEEGGYRLHVQARDALGRLSAETVYPFVVRPPWFRTWWAYSLYALAVFSLLFFAWKYVQMVKIKRLAEEQAKQLAQEAEVRRKLEEANAQLQVANERLRQANKLKDEFLATTSHELRTPLTAILGFTEVLKYELPEDAPYREFLGIIEESGNRLMQTLTSLLEIAKLRAGVMEVQRHPVDLARHAAEVVRMFSEAARKKGLELALVPPPEPVYALLDEAAFERVLSNLVSNAVKFTEKGSVTVAFSRDAEWVHVHVQDTGIGISEAFLPHLFEEFRQESDGLSRSHEGTGLGLAITAKLVELMDGKISVQSKKGEGSCFTVSFRACASLTPERVPARGAVAGGRSVGSTPV